MKKLIFVLMASFVFAAIVSANDPREESYPHEIKTARALYMQPETINFDMSRNIFDRDNLTLVLTCSGEAYLEGNTNGYGTGYSMEFTPNRILQDITISATNIVNGWVVEEVLTDVEFTGQAAVRAILSVNSSSRIEAFSATLEIK